MPIRKRSASPVHVEADDGVDNVINSRADDARGVFDPAKLPIPGSYMEAICGTNAEPEAMHSVMRHIAFSVSQHGQQLAPNDLHVQNALANTRLMDNPGWGVEYRYRNRIRSPLTGIRAMCVITCKSGSGKAVANCTKIQCPLWAFRMGKNGLR